MKLMKLRITPQSAIVFLAAAVVILNLYCLGWVPLSPHKQRGFFMLVFFVLTALLNPPRSRVGKWVLMPFVLMALAGTIYPMIFENRIIENLYRASDIDSYMFIVFTIGIIGVLTRVPGGFFIAGMVAVAVLYMLFGHAIPGLFGHGGFDLKFIASALYLDTDQGAFGSFTDISCRVISIFMVFASLLIVSGLGDVFMAVASRIAGNSVGGPAKVAVISSALFGMLSGSPVANVAATGSFTIPLMKSVGYSPSMAASIEATASTGGNLMPPIMGVGAFLMAQILGIPYFKVCLAAIIPALLWYYVCFLRVHFYALKHDIKKWQPSKEEFAAVMKAKSHLLVAVAALVIGLVWFVAAEQAAFWAVLTLLVVVNMRRETRLNRATITRWLQQYAEMFSPLFVFVVGLGMFIAVLLGAGVHTKIGMVMLGGVEQWYFLLLITSVLTLALGMAVPVTAAYLGAVTIVAPILNSLGYSFINIHMFVFIIATLAPLTPPVAMASFTGARIAGASMFKTGIEASLKSIPLWILPFCLFRDQLYLGTGTPLNIMLPSLAVICLGMLIFIVGAEGRFTRNLSAAERAFAIAIAIMILEPFSGSLKLKYMFVIIGIILLGFWWIFDVFSRRKSEDAQHCR